MKPDHLIEKGGITILFYSLLNPVAFAQYYVSPGFSSYVTNSDFKQTLYVKFSNILSLAEGC